MNHGALPPWSLYGAEKSCAHSKKMKAQKTFLGLWKPHQAK